MALTKVTTGGIKDGTITNEDISATTSISQDKLAATPGASSIASGLMIPADKNKLDGVADNANNYSHPSAHTVSEVTGLQGLLDGKTTETYVNTQITNVIGAAPAALDTLTELAAALGDDANYAATVTTALAGKVDDSQVLTNVPSGALFTDTNTTYSVGDGGLTQVNFTTADNTKLDGIEAGANVTDTTNVTTAGALMDSEVTNLAQVKAFDTTDYATAAQGTTADAALPKAGGTMTGALHSTTGEVIGNKYHSVSENIYWNNKLISADGYGSAPDKWYTQGAVTITSEHPFNKGFSTSYTNTQSSAHTTVINNATPAAPHWKGVYITFSGAVNYGGNQNSSIGGGWENGEGAIMKMVYNGTGASNSTQAVRAKIFKNFFSQGSVNLRQSFFYYIESGEFSSGYFAGYAGTVGGTAENFDEHPAAHKFTNLQEWTYINHAGGSYLGATYQNSTQNYCNGFGFTPGVAAVVWIAIPGLTTSMKSNGHSINIHSATQVIGQG